MRFVDVGSVGIGSGAMLKETLVPFTTAPWFVVEIANFHFGMVVGKR